MMWHGFNNENYNFTPKLCNYQIDRERERERESAFALSSSLFLPDVVLSGRDQTCEMRKTPK